MPPRRGLPGGAQGLAYDKAEATSRCGRIRKKQHRHDPSLAVGLDLPRPVDCRRFAFLGHKQVYAKATSQAERHAALACGGTGWHYNAKHALTGPTKCLCSKLWPSRAHLLWSCPSFVDERSSLPAPVDRAEERLLGSPSLSTRLPPRPVCVPYNHRFIAFLRRPMPRTSKTF